MFAFANVCIKKLREAQETNCAGDRGAGTLETGWGVRVGRRILTIHVSTDAHICRCVYACGCRGAGRDHFLLCVVLYTLIDLQSACYFYGNNK